MFLNCVAVADKLIGKEVVEFGGNQYFIRPPSAAVPPADAANAPSLVDANTNAVIPAVSGPGKIEVSNIPSNVGKETLQAIFENKRYTGLLAVEVTDVEFIPNDKSRAILTLAKKEGRFIC